MGRIVRTSLLLALGASCSAPSLDRTNWTCDTNADCGSGWVCNTLVNSVCEPADEDVNGVFDDRLVMGMSAALEQGVATDLGKGMQNGILAAFERVNRAGGVHGRQLQLEALDDGYEPDPALQNMHTLIDGPDRHVFGIIGNVGTPTAAVTVPYANQKKVLFFGAFTGAGLLRKDPPDRYVFNYRASYKQETAQIVRYLRDMRKPEIQPENIGVLPQGNANSADPEDIDAYGNAGLDGVKDALLATDNVDPARIYFHTYTRNTTDLRAASRGFLGWLANHERRGDNSWPSSDIRAAVIMVATATPAAAFIIQLLDDLLAIQHDGNVADFDPSSDQVDQLKRVKEIVFASVSSLSSVALAAALDAKGTYAGLIDEASRSYCKNVIVTQVVPLPSSGSDGVVQYRAALAAHDESLQPGFVSLEGYIAAQLLIAGLKQQGRDINMESFLDTLNSLQDVDLGIGPLLGFSPSDHQASDMVWGSKLTDACTFESLDLQPTQP